MKNYVVRLRDWKGNIIDGEIYSASNTENALRMYKARCIMVGIDIAYADHITVEEIEI